MSVLRAVGLMSGTSLDGIDVAYLATDGEDVVETGPSEFYPYEEAERNLLRRALAEAETIRERSERPGAVAAAETMVTARHEAAVRAFLQAARIGPASLDIIGFHGQTVLHRPADRLTIQIGDGATLARRLGIPVVYDFRAADVAAGGQGAPLVPVYHRALVNRLKRPGPVAIVNIGGVANVTYVDDEDIRACDTGPGNALIDDLMKDRTGVPMDKDGAAAANGRVQEDILARLMSDPFFQAAPPKSLDRNAFAAVAAEATRRLSVEDAAATLAGFTAGSIAAAAAAGIFPKSPHAWLVAGGGAHNRTLMRMLARRLSPAMVESAEAAGWSADALEAQAFAYLAVRARKGLPLTYPATTGAPRPLTGGVLALP